MVALGVALSMAGCGGSTASGAMQPGQDVDDEGDDAVSGGEGDGDTEQGGGDGDRDPAEGDGDSAGDGDGDADAGGGDGDAPNEPRDAPEADKLPKPKGSCPTLANGPFSYNGATVQLTVGTQPGPVYFYFHGTGSSPDEVDLGIPGAREGVKTNGGLVATWDISSPMGESTGSVWEVWHTGDFDVADQILACAIEQAIADVSHVHVAGYSAGGLQAGAMVYMRSNYLASAVVYSGGRGVGASVFQDSSNIPSVVFAHGAKGGDVFIIDFAVQSENMTKKLKAQDGFVVDCNDGGVHVDFGRLGIGGHATAFFETHGYGRNDYGTSLPSDWPSFCEIVP